MEIYKSIVVIVMFVITIPFMTACIGNKSATLESPKNLMENTDDTGAVTNVYKDKYDPPITITTVWGIDPKLHFKNGETIEKNIATEWAKNTLGIDIKSLWSVMDANHGFTTKLRLSVNSENELPDVVTVGDVQFAQELIDSGLFREVGSLFDTYANETWKTAMELDEDLWDPYKRDGERMGIPVLDYAYNHEYLLWIRQDWLDKLDLQAPKTIEELEGVLERFKNDNPDGLQPSEVVPLSIGSKNKLNTWMGDPSWIFGAYGTLPEQWNVADDGSLEYGSINVGMKQGLQTLSEWHAKGYISKEMALRDESEISLPAVAGTAGIIPGPYWMGGWPLSDTKKNVPDAIWKPYSIPTGADGMAMRHGTQFTNGVTLISKDMKHPEALFTYQNYMFANYANPRSGSEFDYGLFKNYDYDLAEDGSLVRWDEIPGGHVDAVHYLLVRNGARIPDAQMKALMNLADGAEPTTRLEREVDSAYGLETPEAASVMLSQEAISFKNMYTGPPTETMNAKLDYLNKIELKLFNEIIYGDKPVNAFDAFVEQWQSEGGKKITEEVNAWYELENE